MNRLLLSTLFGSLLIYTPPMLAEDGMHHGQGMMHGEGHKMHHDDDWHATLSKPQQIKIDKSHLTYLQKVSPVKAKIKVAKIDLALLVTANEPNQDAINKKIDEIAKLSAEKIQLKAAHQIEVRAILSEEQRMKFDLHVLNKARSDKHGGHH